MQEEQLTEALRSREAQRITWIGFIVNALLTAFKLFAGIQGHSAAMVADAVHSLSDFFTDIVVLVGFRFTDKPEDEDHNYGHGKYETLATVIIALALLLVGYKIMSAGLANMYGVLFKGSVLEKPSLIALVAAVASILSKEALYRYTAAVGKRIKSSAVIANGWHHRSDAFSSIGTLIGISGAIFLGERWTILDPVASVIVSFFIFKVAFEILAPAIGELVEASLTQEETKFITDTIGSIPQILGHHHLRSRRIGNRVAVEVHLVFQRDTALFEAHETATRLEHLLLAYFGSRSIITTHLETSKNDDDRHRLAGS